MTTADWAPPGSFTTIAAIPGTYTTAMTPDGATIVTSGAYKGYTQTGAGLTWESPPNFGAAPVAPAAAPTPAPAPAHLQFAPQTIGAPTFLIYGNCRVPGQIIWAEDITPSSSEVVTSTLSFAVAFGEPIDPTEVVTAYKMWANGTKFYDVGQGGVIDVGNIDADTIAQLQACIASMRVYSGSESQLPDAAIVADAIGNGYDSPAYRGLRYIVFTDFPLLISGNSVPNINVEFRGASTSYLVKDVMVLLAAHFGRALTVTGLDSESCKGLVVQNAITLAQHLANHKPIYGYQIVDGNPIRIIRRVVESSLVIDVAVAEEDLVRRGQAPAISAQRIEPSTIPVGVDLHYTDVDWSYDVKTQQARHDGTAASSAIISYTSDYISDATTARVLAFDILYQARSRALDIQFEMTDLRPEVGDVIEVTRTNGDLYVCLVDKQTNSKTRSNMIQSFALLTSAGVDVDGIGGSNRTRAATLYWPEECVWYQFIPTATRIWSNRFLGLNYNTNPPTKRKISRSMYASDDFADNMGNGGFELGFMFEDATYVYGMDYGHANIWRCRKDATNVESSLQKIEIPQLCNPYHCIYDQASVFRDGKLYLTTQGTNGFNADQNVLFVVDIWAWDPTAFVAHDWTSGGVTGYAGYPNDLSITDNGTVVISTNQGTHFDGHLYWSTLADLTTWTEVIGLGVNPGEGCCQGNYIYITDVRLNPGSNPAGNYAGVSNHQKKIMVIDCTSGTPSPSVIDITTKDANITNIAQRVYPNEIFCSPTHLFVPCNSTRAAYTGVAATSDYPPQERMYLARLDLVTLNGAGGALMRDLYPSEYAHAYHGRYFDGKIYISLLLEVMDARIIIVNEDLTNPQSYPPRNTPSNDDFEGAVALTLDVPVTGLLSWGTTQANEPIPGWAWDGVSTTFPGTYPENLYNQISRVESWAWNCGHSVWFSFHAPATRDYHVSAIQPFMASINNGAYWHSVQIYTGANLASLTEVASAQGYNGGSAQAAARDAAGPLVWSATAGVTYWISVRHDSNGAFGPGFAENGSTMPELDKLEGKYTIVVEEDP